MEVRAVFSTSKESYTERMKKRGRPLSPALTIYAFPIAALSSITVRITGCILTAGCTGVAVASLVHPDVAGLMMCLGSSGIGPAAKFSVAFPLLYHYTGAMRHTMWDFFPETVQNAGVEQSSWLLFGTATVGAVGASMISFDSKPSK